MVDQVSASPAGLGSLAQMANGSFIGSGNAASLILGFTPRLVTIVNETQNIVLQKLQSQAVPNCVKTVGAGTQTIDTTGLVLFPADAGLNEPGSTVLLAASMANVGDVIHFCVQG